MKAQDKLDSQEHVPVLNRQRLVKDPATGKRRARRNRLSPLRAMGSATIAAIRCKIVDRDRGELASMVEVALSPEGEARNAKTALRDAERRWGRAGCGGPMPP